MDMPNNHLIFEIDDPMIASLGYHKTVAMKTIQGNPMDLKAADTMSTDEKTIMEACIDAFFTDEIIGGAVEIMVGMSISDHTLTELDEDNAELYDWYLRDVLEIDNFLEEVFWGLLVTNNVYFQRILGIKEVPEDIKIDNANKVVGRYQALNPLAVTIEGPLTDPDKLVYKIQQEMEDLESDTAEDELTLNADDILHISDKREYQRYGMPIIRRALPSILRKNKMFSADIATLNGLINQIVLVTLASPEEGELESISSGLSNISRAMTLIYDDRLKVEFKHPDIDILGSEKYDDVNDTISNTMGVNFGFTNKKTSYASGTIELRLLTKRLARLRKIVARVITKELRRFAKAVGLKDRVIFRFKPFDLENEKFISSVLLPLRREGLLSAYTTLNSANFNPENEFKQLEEEQKLQKKGLLLPLNNNPNAGKPAGTPSDYPDEREEVKDSPMGNE